MNINPKFAVVILTLANSLSARGVPFTINILWDGLQIKFPWNNGDIVCHSGSYGADNGYAESAGCPWDDEDVTMIDIDTALHRIIDWYEETGE